MLTPERLFGVLIELIFVLLGLLVIWLGLVRHVYVERHGAAWLILSVALIVWGLRALYRPGQWWSRWQNWTRGLSLLLLGALMLIISRVPFHFVDPLLAAGGGLIAWRGIMGTFLVLRPR
ncbi:MAG TPA: hypothetical protein VMR90_07495 [Candidatus Cybelea sp.]|nr:hypothetical protein [Candidatus Cybelea sp.]